MSGVFANGFHPIESAWTTFDYVMSGGWVMLPMWIVSVFMWFMIIERFRTYGRLAGPDLETLDALSALDGAALPDKSHGVRRQLMDRFLAARTGRVSIDRAVLRHVNANLRRRLRSRLAVIAVLAAVAPLLGLLGTVMGMIETFEAISKFGAGNAKAMAGGISVALVATQAGLLIAVPGLFISSMLARRAKQLEGALDEFALSVDRFLRGETDDTPSMEAAS
jgi:biopolymer transport protein ExbB